jgi:pyridoxine kinase
MCRLVVPRIAGAYTGTGDLTAALLLAWLYRDPPRGLPEVLEKAVATVQAILKRTYEEGGGDAELRLVQSKQDIERYVGWAGPGEQGGCRSFHRT